MIFLYRARLVILSQPKTGTTALDSALSTRASIAVHNPPVMKHMQYQKFMSFVAPWIKAQAGLERSEYEVVSVMREPVDWLGSWYRYRTRDVLNQGSKKQRGNYTGGVSFDDFVQDSLKPKAERPRYTNIGSPCGVAMTSDGGIGCDRIFPYEDLSGLYERIAAHTKGALDIQTMNVSPDGDVTLSDETRAKLKAALPLAFELHAALKRDGSIDPSFKLGRKDAATDVDDDAEIN